MHRIPLPIKEGIEFILIDDIVFFSSDRNYSALTLASTETRKHIFRSLKQLEADLGDKGFFRVHQEYLINLHHILRYEKNEGGVIIMTNGTKISVARSRKQEFLEKVMGK